MEIFNLIKNGVHIIEISKQFVDDYFKEESSTNEAVGVFVNFLISLSVNQQKSLDVIDFNDIDKINPGKLFENFGPHTLNNLSTSEEYDELVFSILKYMSSKNDLTLLNQKFLIALKGFLKLLQCSDIKGMLDFSTYFSTTFMKGISGYFCKSDSNAKEPEVWFKICGEFVALTYMGISSPYFGYSALDQICYLHEHNLTIFRYDPPFFINFVKGLKFKVVRMKSRILNSIITILRNSSLLRTDIEIFKHELLNNFDFIFAMFIQSEKQKLINLFIILFEILEFKFELTECQKLELLKKIIRTRGSSKDMGSFFINILKNKNYSDKKILLYILLLLTKLKAQRRFENITAILWDNLLIVRDINVLLIYFVKFDNIEELCTLAWLIVSVVDCINQNLIEDTKTMNSLLRYLPFLIKNQKEKNNFQVIKVLLKIVKNLNISNLYTNEKKNIDKLLVEIFDLFNCDNYFGNENENKIFIKNLFVVLNEFHAFEKTNDLVCKFIKNLLIDFFSIVENSKNDGLDNETYKRFRIINLKVGEVVLHNCGIANIELDSLIALLKEELSVDGFFLRSCSKYSDYSIIATALKCYCDCLCLLKESVNLKNIVKENFEEYLYVQIISLTEFLISLTAIVKDFKLIVEVMYILGKCIPILYEYNNKKDDHIIYFYEQMIELAFEFIFNRAPIYVSEAENKNKIIMDILLEMHKNCLPNSDDLWKLLIHVGDEHSCNIQLKSLIDSLLQSFKNRFVNIFASLLYNVGSVEKAETAIAIIRKMCKEKYPLKKGDSLSKSYLNLEAATILTLIQKINEKLFHKYVEDVDEINYSDNNILNCLDFLAKDFFHVFRFSKRNKEILLNQVSSIHTNFFHKMNAEEKFSFKNFRIKCGCIINVLQGSTP